MPILFLFFVGGLVGSIAIFSEAKSAIHEIGGLLLILAAVVSLTAALVIGRLDSLIKAVHGEPDKPGEK